MLPWYQDKCRLTRGTLWTCHVASCAQEVRLRDEVAPPLARAVGRTGCACSAARAATTEGRGALLIDGDNVRRAGQRHTEEIEEYVGGTQVDRRVYGDFSHVRNEAWRAAGMEHGLALVMQASAKGKNATDIALSIDAMDILHGGDRSAPVDTFVIVTNDGDFAPLAQRFVARAGAWCMLARGPPCSAQLRRAGSRHIRTAGRALPPAARGDVEARSSR